MEKINIETLKDKDVKELERIKLIEEIKEKIKENAAPAPPLFEEQKFAFTKRIENNKLWLGPVFTLIATLILTYILKNEELRSSNIAETRKTIIEYKAQLDTADNTKRKQYLSEIIANYPDYGDPNIKNLQSQAKAVSLSQDSVKYLNANINQNAPATDSLKISAIAKAALNNSDSAQIQLQNARINGSSDKQQISDLQSIINTSNDTASKNLPNSVRQAINDVGVINNSLKSQISSFSPSSQNDVIKDFGVTWFKAGYYLQFDTMRVLLQNIDRQSGRIQVQICKTISENCILENSIITNLFIDYNNPVTLKVGIMAYQISLNAIDHAGSNPFKLAAYINVTQVPYNPVLNLSDAVIKIYSLPSTASKAKELNNTFKDDYNIQSGLGLPQDNPLNNVSTNQIVFYNNNQIKYCQAIQDLLWQKGKGFFYIRPSSGFGYNANYFKIYLVK